MLRENGPYSSIGGGGPAEPKVEWDLIEGQLQTFGDGGCGGEDGDQCPSRRAAGRRLALPPSYDASGPPRTGRVPRLLPALFGRAPREHLDRNDYQREVDASEDHARSDVPDDDVSAVSPRVIVAQPRGMRAGLAVGGEEDIVRTPGDPATRSTAGSRGRTASTRGTGALDTVGIPDYLKIVRRPMDYGTITRNLINGQYAPQETQEGRDLPTTG
ncbi:hypothetical protein THAOC_11806, partial [Thalassiosira oceanica]